MIAIFDYGSGNLKSAQRAFASTGRNVVVTSDTEVATRAKGLVIPGVGAFGACMAQLISAGGDELINNRISSGDPILGICVGMQILFSSSSEKGEHKGLGVVAGEIRKLDNKVLPHIGWNTLTIDSTSRLFKGIEEESFYFVHSYAANQGVEGAANSYSEYGESFLAAFEKGPVSATQFHPEKSGTAGLRMISNWVDSL